MHKQILLQFYDHINDGQIDQAIECFKKPLDHKPAGFDKLNASDFDKSSDNLIEKKQKSEKMAEKRPAILKKDIESALRQGIKLNEAAMQRTWEVAEMQAYLLSARSDDGRNVLHKVCRIGNR